MAVKRNVTIETNVGERTEVKFLSMNSVLLGDLNLWIPDVLEALEMLREEYVRSITENNLQSRIFRLLNKDDGQWTIYEIANNAGSDLPSVRHVLDAFCASGLIKHVPGGTDGYYQRAQEWNYAS